jgi:hypothetical protein
LDDLLDADCVFNALFIKGVLAKRIWRLNRVSADNYDVNFELANSARIVGFTVYIKGTCHCIGITALINQSKRFNVPIDDIILQCALK